MSDLIGSIFSGGPDSSADQTLAWNVSAGLASATQDYVAATLAASTPEVRHLFSEYASQTMMAHEALTGLMVKKAGQTRIIPQLHNFKRQYDNPSRYTSQQAITKNLGRQSGGLCS